jgi:hypothetical protein
MNWTDPDANRVLDYDSLGAPYVLDHPISHIEPSETTASEIRSAHIRCVALLNQAFSQLQHVLEQPAATVNDALITLYGIGYGLGLNCCGNTTLTSKAAELNCSKAILSRIATSFCEATGLEPSFYMKRASCRKAYAQCRREVVAQNGNGWLKKQGVPK